MHMRFLSRGFKNLQWYGMTLACSEPLQAFLYANCSSFPDRLNIPFIAWAEASCAE